MAKNFRDLTVYIKAFAWAMEIFENPEKYQRKQ